MGLKVFGTAGTEEGLDIVLQNGAHAVFNHNESDYFDKILVYCTCSFNGKVHLFALFICFEALQV